VLGVGFSLMGVWVSFFCSILGVKFSILGVSLGIWVG